jgi:hypothetical protein
MVILCIEASAYTATAVSSKHTSSQFKQHRLVIRRLSHLVNRKTFDAVGERIADKKEIAANGFWTIGLVKYSEG